MTDREAPRGSIHIEDVGGITVNLDDPLATLAHVLFAQRYGHGCLRFVVEGFVQRAIMRRLMFGASR